MLKHKTFSSRAETLVLHPTPFSRKIRNDSPSLTDIMLNILDDLITPQIATKQDGL